MQTNVSFIGNSFPIKNRILRFFWNITAFIFFRFSPRTFHNWRAFILRCFGAKVDRGVHVYPGVKIWAPWNLILKEECGIADGVILYSMDKIVVGKKAVISQGTHLCAGTHDYTKIDFPLITIPIYIGDFVWIAAETFVHPGIVIGDGCVVGARSVVTKNLPPWMVCVGQPCIPIKKRLLFQKEGILM